MSREAAVELLSENVVGGRCRCGGRLSGRASGTTSTTTLEELAFRLVQGLAASAPRVGICWDPIDMVWTMALGGGAIGLLAPGAALNGPCQ